MASDEILSGKRNFAGASIGWVTFETNGFQGGDGGHGGYLQIEIKDEANLAFDAAVDGRKSCDINTLTIMFKGDSEIKAAVDFFGFLGKRLTQIYGSDR